MMEFAQLQAQLEMEKRHLHQADADLTAGRERLGRQLSLLASLQDSGQNTVEAEKLAHLLSDTLGQWEQHRNLIAERAAHLERCLSDYPPVPDPPKA